MPRRVISSINVKNNYLTYRVLRGYLSISLVSSNVALFLIEISLPHKQAANLDLNAVPSRVIVTSF